MIGCFVVLIAVLHADGVVVAVVLSVVQHNVSPVDDGERMTTSKNDILDHRWSLEKRGLAENYQPITNECAENYHPFTNEYPENYQPITNE